jgi:Calcineurin-like phosphoesterase
MNFFICSDLHIERQYPTVPKVREVFKGVNPNSRLVLNGDVGRLEHWEQYISFISACCSYFQSVFLVLGNHEYYVESDMGPSIDELFARMKNLESLHDNLKILDNTAVVLGRERLVIFGSTFWSFYPDTSSKSPGEPRSFSVLEPTQKFPNVPINLADGRRITASSWNALHFTAKAALERTIHQAQKLGYRLMVITHHAPTFKNTLDEKYKDAGVSNSLYCSDCDEYLSDKLVALWIYGHTGHNAKYCHDGGTFVYSNQYGKPGYSTELITPDQFEIKGYIAD